MCATGQLRDKAESRKAVTSLYSAMQMLSSIPHRLDQDRALDQGVYSRPLEEKAGVVDDNQKNGLARFAGRGSKK